MSSPKRLDSPGCLSARRQWPRTLHRKPSCPSTGTSDRSKTLEGSCIEPSSTKPERGSATSAGSALKAVRLSREYGALTPADADLFDLVGTLPYRQRVVIVARYWGGWSEAEIAQVLGCRPGTVKSLASRALTQLRQEVGP